MSIPEELMQAYKSSSYKIIDGLLLKIDSDLEVVSKLLHKMGVISATFVTAYNPFSVKCTYKENEFRNTCLRNTLDKMGFTYHDSVIFSDDGEWSENAFLICDISDEEANHLLIKYEQNAGMKLTKDGNYLLLRAEL